MPDLGAVRDIAADLGVDVIVTATLKGDTRQRYNSVMSVIQLYVVEINKGTIFNREARGGRDFADAVATTISEYIKSAGKVAGK